MGRDVPFDPDDKCDKCGKPGAWDVGIILNNITGY